MFLARFIAVAFFLQGVLPTFLLGVWRPVGWLLACIACLYTLLAWSLWQRQRWAPLAAAALTLPQLAIFNSSWLGWRFFVGGSWGFGFTFADTLGQMRIFGYSSWGAAINFGVGQAAPLADFPGYLQGGTFVLLNLFAIPFLALLLLQLALKLIATDRLAVPEPNHALQRTPST